jgi:AcrR family transcriptional regulator
MAAQNSRQKLTQAALSLFLTQGVSLTTTRQIAEAAGVNEATLFRNFGNKYGLLLAMFQEIPVATTGPQLQIVGQSDEDLRAYARACLQLLEQASTFLRSLIGEADQFSPEHLQVLRGHLSAIKQDMAGQLHRWLGPTTSGLSAEELASFLGALLLGYNLVEVTGGYALWENQDAFLDALVTILEAHRRSPLAAMVPSDAAEPGAIAVTSAPPLIDLPATQVHQLLQQARSLGPLDYALAYVLFGAGLLPAEVIRLERGHQICDKTQHVLQVIGPTRSRQVPINQWILGKRYGSYTSNPLTKWLKTRKDEVPLMFVTAATTPLSLADLQHHWTQWCEGSDGWGPSPQLHHAHQTWCVEMLMRGMSLENLSILAGCEVTDLSLYAQRAREKAAIAEATELDRKP